MAACPRSAVLIGILYRFVPEVGVDLQLRLIGLLSRAQVGRCELEGVEEQTCAAHIDVVGGETGHDFAERLQDGVGAGGCEEGEGAAACDALVRVDDDAARVVVVVAELLITHAGAAAARVVGKDVVALVVVIGVVVVRGGFVVHGIPLVFVQSLQSK